MSNQQNENDNKKGLLVPILGIALLGMVGFNIYLMYNKNEQTQTIEKQVVALTKSDSLKSELQRQYDESVKELDAQKTSNADLNAQRSCSRKQITMYKKSTN